MKSLAKYWKLIIALILVLAALWIYFTKYQTEKAAYEAESQQIQSIISVLETQLENNLKYKDIQDELDAAKAELEQSRVELYQHLMTLITSAYGSLMIKSLDIRRIIHPNKTATAGRMIHILSILRIFFK